MSSPGAGGTGHSVLTAPVVAGERAALAGALAELRDTGRPVTLVPTMGALHAGHLALLRRARALGGAVVVSIFVNPLQFGPTEDLSRYPRTFDADLRACAEEGVSLVFAPTSEVMYGAGTRVTVHPGQLGAELEGASRPGHFGGVLTVVAKLFGLIRPDVAVFGEKDYQQLTLIRQLVSDLDLGVRVMGVPTVREPDGLALSSRNKYLSTVERAAAARLSAALRAGVAAAASGPAAVLAAGQAELAAESRIALDYLVLRAPDLAPPPLAGPARLLVAARVGSTRLIDNMPLVLAAAPAAAGAGTAPRTAGHSSAGAAQRAAAGTAQRAAAGTAQRAVRTADPPGAPVNG
jgi:pantoate--beta-alanine ligase